MNKILLQLLLVFCATNLTRFSLDTDWRRAIAAAMAELKKEEYQF